MGRIYPREFMYSKMPLSVGDNRDENILVEVLGNWIPECDMVYYGLLNSDYSDKFSKLRDKTQFNAIDTYLDTSFFNLRDLVRYLASPGDELADISDEVIDDALKTAFDQYFYVPCNETMIRHAIIELAYYDFAKSITLLYPWELRQIDIAFLRSIIPPSRMHKFKVVSGNLLDYLKDTSPEGKYTTLILNSLSDVNTLIDNCDEYHTDTACFLLRNHSGNVKYSISEDPENPGKNKISFEEIGTAEILSKLMDIENGIPTTQMRFGRFEPILFKEATPDSANFMYGQ